MKKNTIFRIITDIIIAIAVINGWWLIALPVAVIATWKFEYYFEIIVAGIAYDALFGIVPDRGIVSFLGTAVALVVFCLVIIFRKLVRSHL